MHATVVAEDHVAERPSFWARVRASTFPEGIAGAALVWAALPPLGLWPLAFVAVVPWLRLADRAQLPGLRPYRTLWLCGFFGWLATLYWLTFPYWATGFGWLALSFYLAFYLPAFVALVRVGRHRLGLPMIVVAPVVWVGLELVRAYLMTGFMLAVVAHAVARVPVLLQIADLGGAYLISFLMISMAAAVAGALPTQGNSRRLWPLGYAAGLLAATLGYGMYRLGQPTSAPVQKVALIQGSLDSSFDPIDGEEQRTFDDYLRLSQQAIAEHPDVDLIVWPEAMFRFPWTTFSPEMMRSGALPQKPEVIAEFTRSNMARLPILLGKPVILGIDTHHWTAADRVEVRNSAVLLDAQGNVRQQYAKMHRVMFGEYIPWADSLPFLYKFSPLTMGLRAGEKAEVFAWNGVTYSPSICFESTNPQLIRAQASEVTPEGKTPDVLVNLTNDGWFWGSPALDLHLACAVLRAVELHKPMLVAANTGFSAHIDGSGRILQQGPRRAEGILLAEVALDGRPSLYLRAGDWFAGLMLLGTLGIGIGGWISARRRAPKKSAA